MSGLGALVLLGFVVVLAGGGSSAPTIDVDRPSEVLMRAGDFSYDMVARSDPTRYQDKSYPLFGIGSDCGADIEMARILAGATVVSERYFEAADGLVQFVTFEQVIFRFPNDSTPARAVRLVSSEFNSPGCVFEEEYISVRFYNLSSGQEVFDTIGETSVVFYKDTAIESSFLDANLRETQVWIAQDEYLFITRASFDSDMQQLSFAEFSRSVTQAINKAYGQ